jgi:hypothetical protein
MFAVVAEAAMANIAQHAVVPSQGFYDSFRRPELLPTTPAPLDLPFACRWLSCRRLSEDSCGSRPAHDSPHIEIEGTLRRADGDERAGTIYPQEPNE